MIKSGTSSVKKFPKFHNEDNEDLETSVSEDLCYILWVRGRGLHYCFGLLCPQRTSIISLWESAFLLVQEIILVVVIPRMEMKNEHFHWNEVHISQISYLLGLMIEGIGIVSPLKNWGKSDSSINIEAELTCLCHLTALQWVLWN